MRPRNIGFPVLISALFAVASTTLAQGNPRRFPLAAAADTNSWQAYYDEGTRLLESDPKKAADAFLWAMKLEPTRPEPYYGRRIAMLVSDPRRLLRYWRGEKSTVRSREIQQIDSLYLYALTLNPFFYHSLDRFLLKSIVQELAANLSRGSGMSEGQVRIALDQSINSADPGFRAWVATSEGEFDLAERQYAQAISESNNKRQRASLLTERARLYFQRDKGELALADISRALDEMRRADKKDLIFVYESKALAEQGMGMVQQRLGNTAAAREAFARSLQEDLSYFPAHVRLALLALDGKDTVTALSEMDLAVQIKPDDAGLRYLSGFTLSAVGKGAEASEQLRKAIELDTFYAAPHHTLAKVLEAGGKPQEALSEYRTFLSLAAQNDPRRADAGARAAALSGAQ